MANNTIVISVDVGETRVALIENGILAELYLERERDRSPVGNVYLGKVTRVLPGMQAAFVDIGLDRAAFLHVEDVIPTKDFDQLVSKADDGDDEDDDNGIEKHRGRVTRKTPIRDVLKEGQQIVVQVSKGPISTKGARVTSHVSLPGRYVVYLPTVDHIGISKRIGNARERARLRKSIEAIKPANGGLIVRTVAEGLTKKQLKADIGYLIKVWADVAKRRETAKSAEILYEELDLVLKAARDLFTDEVQQIVIDDREQHGRLCRFVEMFMPNRVKDIKLYTGEEPV